MGFTTKEALWVMRKEVDGVINNYEKIILEMDKQLIEYEQKIKELEQGKESK